MKKPEKVRAPAAKAQALKKTTPKFNTKGLKKTSAPGDTKLGLVGGVKAKTGKK